MSKQGTAKKLHFTYVVPTTTGIAAAPIMHITHLLIHRRYSSAQVIKPPNIISGANAAEFQVRVCAQRVHVVCKKVEHEGQDTTQRTCGTIFVIMTEMVKKDVCQKLDAPEGSCSNRVTCPRSDGTCGINVRIYGLCVNTICNLFVSVCTT